MASVLEETPATNGESKKNDVVLEVLREISGQLSEQSNRLSIVVSRNCKASFVHAKRTESLKGLLCTRTLAGESNIERGFCKDGALEDVESAKEQSQTSTKEGLTYDWCSEDFCPQQSSSNKSNQLESYPGLMAPIPSHSLQWTSKRRIAVLHSPPKESKQSLDRQRKPSRLAYLFKKSQAPDEPDFNEAAARILVPGTQLSLEQAPAFERLEDVRTALGKFRDSPVDNRLHALLTYGDQAKRWTMLKLQQKPSKPSLSVVLHMISRYSITTGFMDVTFMRSLCMSQLVI